MRMAGLSKATGIPIPTIKFYLREGLLPAGQRTSPNQSQYDDDHVHRLGLIRGLTEIGGLPLAVIAEILAVMDDPALPLHEVFGAVQRTVTRQITNRHGMGVEPRYDLVDAVMRERGWNHPDNSEHRLAAATLLALMESLRLRHSAETLSTYALAAEMTAEVDLAGVKSQSSRQTMIENIVATTFLGDALLATLRRMAQTVTSAEQFGGPAGVSPP